MISLSEYIIESFEDNLFWKIDKYFERSNEERKQFYDIVDYFRENPSTNKKQIEEYLKEHPFKNLKKFIDFLDDVIGQETDNRDYEYLLCVIVKRILGSKEESEKYTNKK